MADNGSPLIWSLFAATSLLAVCGATPAAPTIDKKHLGKTPTAAYQKDVVNRIGKLWYFYVGRDSTSFPTGTVKISFRINSQGEVKNLRIVSNTSNRAFANMCVKAVMEAGFSRIPPAVATETGRDWMDCEEIGFTIYPN